MTEADTRLQGGCTKASQQEMNRFKEALAVTRTLTLALSRCVAWSVYVLEGSLCWVDSLEPGWEVLVAWTSVAPAEVETNRVLEVFLKQSCRI